MNNSMGILNAAAFFLRICTILHISVKQSICFMDIFMDISGFEASTSPSNLYEVIQQLQELLGDWQIVWLHQLKKLLFSYESTIKIANLFYANSNLVHVKLGIDNITAGHFFREGQARKTQEYSVHV